MSDNVVVMNPKRTARPANPLFSEAVSYSTQVEIGFDAISQAEVIAFRRVGDKTHFIPCPDAATACTVLLLMHMEIKLSKKTYGLTWKEGFGMQYVEEELEDIFLHFGPHLKIMSENEVEMFDALFDRDDHLERVLDGREPVVDEI